MIHAAEEIHGVLHSRVAADFSAVKLCDFKMNRFTRGRRFEIIWRKQHKGAASSQKKPARKGVSERAF